MGYLDTPYWMLPVEEWQRRDILLELMDIGIRVPQESEDFVLTTYLKIHTLPQMERMLQAFDNPDAKHFWIDFHAISDLERLDSELRKILLGMAMEIEINAKMLIAKQLESDFSEREKADSEFDAAKKTNDLRLSVGAEELDREIGKYNDRVSKGRTVGTPIDPYSMPWEWVRALSFYRLERLYQACAYAFRPRSRRYKKWYRRKGDVLKGVRKLRNTCIHDGALLPVILNSSSESVKVSKNLERFEKAVGIKKSAIHANALRPAAVRVATIFYAYTRVFNEPGLESPHLADAMENLHHSIVEFKKAHVHWTTGLTGILTYIDYFAEMIANHPYEYLSPVLKHRAPIRRK